MWSLRSQGSSGDDNGASPMARRRHSILPSNVMQAVIGVKFIADHMKQQHEENKVALSPAYYSDFAARLPPVGIALRTLTALYRPTLYCIHTLFVLLHPGPVSYTHLTLPTNREV